MRQLVIFNEIGVLVECDPSIKAIILKIDQEKHDYIVEDLDDQTLVIKESQLQRLKDRLEEVSHAKLCESRKLELKHLTGVGKHPANAGRQWVGLSERFA